MRIFYASGERPNQALPGSEVWRKNLYLALVDLGHDVVELDYDLNPLLRHADPAIDGNAAFIAEHRPAAEAALLAQLEAAHRAAPIDLFFSYFYAACATPATIQRIRALGIRTMNWYCNGSYQFDLVAELAPAYDWSLVPEAFRLADYRRVGANPIYCQEAANPLVYRPVPVERDLDVVFVGARYGERPALIRRLVDAAVPVRVFGPGWERWTTPGAGGSGAAGLGPAQVSAPRRRSMTTRLLGLATGEGRSRAARRLRRALGGGSPTSPRGADSKRDAPIDEVRLSAEIAGPALSDDEMVEMYSRAKISLGFSSVGNAPLEAGRILQVRLRDFEAPMSGAFYLVEDMPELREFFDVGTEIETYRDPDELVEKCRFYLAHPAEREAIRLAGHRRALRDHSWQRRLTTVFESVGLVPPQAGPGSTRPAAPAGGPT